MRGNASNRRFVGRSHNPTRPITNEVLLVSEASIAAAIPPAPLDPAYEQRFRTLEALTAKEPVNKVDDQTFIFPSPYSIEADPDAQRQYEESLSVLTPSAELLTFSSPTRWNLRDPRLMIMTGYGLPDDIDARLIASGLCAVPVTHIQSTNGAFFIPGSITVNDPAFAARRQPVQSWVRESVSTRSGEAISKVQQHLQHQLFAAMNNQQRDNSQLKQGIHDSTLNAPSAPASIAASSLQFNETVDKMLQISDGMAVVEALRSRQKRMKTEM